MKTIMKTAKSMSQIRQFYFMSKNGAYVSCSFVRVLSSFLRASKINRYMYSSQWNGNRPYSVHFIV